MQIPQEQHLVQSNSKSHSRKQHEQELLRTIQKIGNKFEQAQIHLMRTDSKLKKKTIQPANIQTLFKIESIYNSLQVPQQTKELISSLSSTTFVIITRICLITSQSMKYKFICCDQTLGSNQISFFISKNMTTFKKNTIKQNQSDNKDRNISVEEVGSLQFQPNLVVGHPYYKFFIKIGSQLIEKPCESEKTHQIRWIVQNLQHVNDFNEITFHNYNVMLKERGYSSMSKT